MFNKLFGKKEKSAIETLAAEPNVLKRQYPKEVEAIHNEFFTAGDNILQEATCLLKQLEEKDLAKGKRLAALGFNKTKRRSNFSSAASNHSGISTDWLFQKSTSSSAVPSP